jgi:hypothetical protein
VIATEEGGLPCPSLCPPLAMLSGGERDSGEDGDTLEGTRAAKPFLARRK